MYTFTDNYQAHTQVMVTKLKKKKKPNIASTPASPKGFLPNHTLSLPRGNLTYNDSNFSVL